MQGTVVDSKYQVVRMIGRGGMGAVYEARHTGTGRRVALKVIVPEALLSGSDIVPRFQREARASGAIDSQHVVQVLDTGVDPETKRPYLVMEYLHGEDVLQILQRVGPLPVDVVLRLTAQACSGVDRAHAAGIVHRDIKSANIFVAHREDGEVMLKILDFGIAKVRVDPMSTGANNGITKTGSMLGSPLYMAPEQVMGTKEHEPRSDLFSIGVTMYEMLSGNPPNHDCESIGRLIMAICNGNVPGIQTIAPWVTDDVAAIIAKAMAVEPRDRYQTAAEMRAAILALLPQGTSIHESMLVGVAPLSARREPTLMMTPPPTMQMTPPPGIETVTGAPLAQGPSVYPAATSTAFVESSRAAARPTTQRWLPAVASFVIVFALGCAGLISFVVYARTKDIAPVAGSASAVPPPPPAATVTTPAASVAPAPPPVTITAEVDAGPSVRRPAHPAPPAPKPKDNCNPNYYFKDGIKIFKEECI